VEFAKGKALSLRSKKQVFRFVPNKSVRNTNNVANLKSPR